MRPISKVIDYIASIHNADKKRYAHAYASYRLSASVSEAEPKRPYDLSYMAAQAVRLKIDALLREVDK